MPQVDGTILGATVGTAQLSLEGIFDISVVLPEEAKSVAELWYEIAVDSNDSGGIDDNDWFPNRVKVEVCPLHCMAATVESIPLLEGVTSPVQEQLDAKADNAALTDHADNINNPHNVTAAQVGLENVDNTADLDKPISDAVQASQDAQDTIIAQKADATDVYTKNGSGCQTVCLGNGCGHNTANGAESWLYCCQFGSLYPDAAYFGESDGGGILSG